ncbi:MAG: hypothetical protein WAU88_10290 [Candidatus Zixiibacteriota bacterium]
MIQRFSKTFPFAVAAHILLPGLAHALYREYLFGLFIFLIMQLGVALMVVSYLVDMPVLAKWLLLGLPFVFYLFSFVDLRRTVREKSEKMTLRGAPLVVALLAALCFQMLAPVSLGNFAWRNRPELFTGMTSDYSPYVTRGNYSTTNRLAYLVDIPFMDRPLLHALPERFDLIRYLDSTGERKLGLVVGFPGEDVSCTDGILTAGDIITALPQLRAGNLSGSWPLTLVDDRSILVADVKLGTVNSVSQISVATLIGRVGRLSP